LLILYSRPLRVGLLVGLMSAREWRDQHI
jgi:hypothetical protein